MIYRTKKFIELLVDEINKIVDCYYENALEDARFPFAVVNGIHESDLNYGCSLNFYIDLHTDEKILGATEKLESVTDDLRTYLSSLLISSNNEFRSHISVDNRRNVEDKEFDLCNRKITCTARIFYI